MTTTLRVAVHPDTVSALEARGEQQHCDAEIAAGKILRDATGQWPLGGRAIVLTDQTLVALEGILGGGSVLHERDLLQKVQRLAGISFGHIRLDLTPGQLERLDARAQREGRTARDVIAQAAPRILDAVFGLT